MDLDDLELKVKEEKEAELEELDDYEDSTEADLTNALNLLEDCQSVMEDILKMKDKRRVSIYLYERLESLSLEILVFTAQYEVPPKGEKKSESLSNNDWQHDI